MPRFSKKAKRHSVESKQRTKRMLADSARRSGPVSVSYLPGFEPPPSDSDTPRTKFPFKATINGTEVIVMRNLYGQIEIQDA